PGRRVRLVTCPRAGHGARVRARDLGRRLRRPSLRRDRCGHRRRLPLVVVTGGARPMNPDAIIVGREANARQLAGTARLWLAGTRVFSPSCVVIPATGAIYVLANTNVVAPEVPADHLYGITWNPAVLEARLVAIPGLADARVIAVDGMNPAMFALL